MAVGALLEVDIEAPAVETLSERTWEALAVRPLALAHAVKRIEHLMLDLRGGCSSQCSLGKKVSVYSPASGRTVASKVVEGLARRCTMRQWTSVDEGSVPEVSSVSRSCCHRGSSIDSVRLRVDG